jgi:alcohol dehydrogenase
MCNGRDRHGGGDASKYAFSLTLSTRKNTMATRSFVMTAENIMGAGCLADAMSLVQQRGFKHALIVTDAPLTALGVTEKIAALLRERDVQVSVFDGVQPNPTVGNVEAGLAVLKEKGADCIISLGGGSPHDCAKVMAVLATNGGSVMDYRGVNKVKKTPLPLVSINTTAGTASEVTKFAVITEETRHIKMSIVDRQLAPVLSVNDAELMRGMPASLTAATGMDALTHAVEAYVSIIATPVTDACALHAMKLIAQYLPRAVSNGKEDIEAREQMAAAQFLAGMAFNNALLGYVHAMAHQLGGQYNLPHGVCNALLLPHVEAVNASACAPRLADVARAMGVDTTGMSVEAAAQAAVKAMHDLARTVGIPAKLSDLGVKREDFALMAANAIKDGSGLTNPKKLSQDEIVAIFEAAY